MGELESRSRKESLETKQEEVMKIELDDNVSWQLCLESKYEIVQERKWPHRTTMSNNSCYRGTLRTREIPEEERKQSASGKEHRTDKMRSSEVDQQSCLQFYSNHVRQKYVVDSNIVGTSKEFCSPLSTVLDEGWLVEPLWCFYLIRNALELYTTSV